MAKIWQKLLHISCAKVAEIATKFIEKWQTIAISFFAATLRRKRGSEKLQTEEKLTGRFVI